MSITTTGKSVTFSPDLNNINLERLTNSDQLLTVIPLVNNLKDTSSRILLVKVNNEIKSVIFNMISNSSSNSEHFTGKIIITDLNGVFITGFSVKDGILLAKLKKKAPTNTTNKTITIDGVEFEELNEVVITNNYQKGPGKLTLLTLFDSLLEGGGGQYDGINWGYENNGGGGSSSSSTIVSESDLRAKINSTSPAAFEIESLTQPNQVLSTTKFNLLPWTGIKVLIVQNEGNTYTIQTVSSNTWGMNAGYTWTQDAFNQKTNGNITTVLITGTLTYNAGIQGIGNFNSTTILFQININKTNGQILSGQRLP
ncbi:hypothetical protein [Flavobacterium sp.]|uniref:hypothetical protein n=1 Tax=Flavobacterium sp. TaxID=239 RepID=UPI002607BF96|nr:hypothetical protein [Flavobacterium sp.]MDG2431076.1 hypothetical protein [Flavobacterium sp.]